MLAAAPWFIATDADEAGDKAASGWPAEADPRSAARAFKDWTEAAQAGVNLRRWWSDRLGGTEAPALFTWDELAAWRWGPARDESGLADDGAIYAEGRADRDPNRTRELVYLFRSLEARATSGHTPCRRARQYLREAPRPQYTPRWVAMSFALPTKVRSTLTVMSSRPQTFGLPRRFAILVGSDTTSMISASHSEQESEQRVTERLDRSSYTCYIQPGSR